jgi:uncharacterized protein (DUF2164 family)
MYSYFIFSTIFTIKAIKIYTYKIKEISDRIFSLERRLIENVFAHLKQYKTLSDEFGRFNNATFFLSFVSDEFLDIK